MKKIIILFFILSVNFLIFSNNRLVNKFKTILKSYDLYRCYDEETLRALLNNEYNTLKYLNYFKFYIKYDEKNNTLDISEGVLLKKIKECEFLKEKDHFSIKGFYLSQDEPKKYNFIVKFYRNYAVYKTYNEDKNIIYGFRGGGYFSRLGDDLG